MTVSLSNVTFRANAEDVEVSRLVFQEYGISLEDGLNLFLLIVAETKQVPDFILAELGAT
jgi:antitoxin component of RelBE/YafQ-DinJ toxin-antitoxin module